LAMEFFEGVAIDDEASIARLGVDAGRLVDDVIRAWLVTSLADGEFHGDCHAGNVLVLRDGRLGLIDWGIVGVLDARARHFVLRLLEASLGEESAWADIAVFLTDLYGESAAGGLGATNEELPTVIREVLEPLLVAPFGDNSLATFLAKAKERAEAGRSTRNSAEFRETADLARDSSSDVGSFDQGLFLWIKQLVYFERYARIHHRQQSIADYAAEVMPLIRNDQPPPSSESAA
jgi:aarF domain-containing kinase